MELPEVEVMRRDLERDVVGAFVDAVQEGTAALGIDDVTGERALSA